MTTSRFLRSRGCTNSPGQDVSLPERIILFFTHVSESALVSSNCLSVTLTKRNCMERDSSVRIVTRRCAGQHTKKNRLPEKAIYLTISEKMAIRFLFHKGAGGGKPPGNETDRSCPPGAKVKNAWSHTSTLSCPFIEWCLTKYSCTLSLTSELDGGGWSRERPGRFNSGNDPVPHFVGS